MRRVDGHPDTVSVRLIRMDAGARSPKFSVAMIGADALGRAWQLDQEHRAGGEADLKWNSPPLNQLATIHS